MLIFKSAKIFIKYCNYNCSSQWHPKHSVLPQEYVEQTGEQEEEPEQGEEAIKRQNEREEPKPVLPIFLLIQTDI